MPGTGLRAFWSVFILGSSALFIGLSTLIAVDAELLLWIVIGEISLAAIYSRARTDFGSHSSSGSASAWG